MSIPTLQFTSLLYLENINFSNKVGTQMKIYDMEHSSYFFFIFLHYISACRVLTLSVCEKSSHSSLLMTCSWSIVFWFDFLQDKIVMLRTTAYIISLMYVSSFLFSRNKFQSSACVGHKYSHKKVFLKKHPNHQNFGSMPLI